jgi:hypothetical protein
MEASGELAGNADPDTHWRGPGAESNGSLATDVFGDDSSPFRDDYNP